MQYHRLLALVILVWSSFRSAAHADVEHHAWKLTLDASIIDWTKQTARYPDGGRASVEVERTATNLGVLGAGSLVVGFAANRFLIPSLSFGLHDASLQSDDSSTVSRYLQWELRPVLEVALLPSSCFVPFVGAGVSLVRRTTKYEEEDWEEQTKTLGVGPAVSVGLHSFIVKYVSLDVSFTYRALFFGETDASSTVLPEDVEMESQEHALLLNLGVSFWM